MDVSLEINEHAQFLTSLAHLILFESSLMYDTTAIMNLSEQLGKKSKPCNKQLPLTGLTQACGRNVQVSPVLTKCRFASYILFL